MTEALIAALGQIGGPRIISRRSIMVLERILSLAENQENQGKRVQAAPLPGVPVGSKQERIPEHNQILYDRCLTNNGGQKEQRSSLCNMRSSLD